MAEALSSKVRCWGFESLQGHAVVAQMVDALLLKGRCCGFESRPRYINSRENTVAEENNASTRKGTKGNG